MDTHTPSCPGLSQQQGWLQETRPGQGHQAIFSNHHHQQSTQDPKYSLGKGGRFASTTFSNKCKCAKTCCENLKFTPREGQGWGWWKDAVEGQRGEGLGSTPWELEGRTERTRWPRGRLQASCRWRGGALSQSGSPRDGGGAPGERQGSAAPPPPVSSPGLLWGHPACPLKGAFSPTPVCGS